MGRSRLALRAAADDVRLQRRAAAGAGSRSDVVDDPRARRTAPGRVGVVEGRLSGDSELAAAAEQHAGRARPRGRVAGNGAFTDTARHGRSGLAMRVHRSGRTAGAARTAIAYRRAGFAFRMPAGASGEGAVWERW